MANSYFMGILIHSLDIELDEKKYTLKVVSLGLNQGSEESDTSMVLFVVMWQDKRGQWSSNFSMPQDSSVKLVR